MRYQVIFLLFFSTFVNGQASLEARIKKHLGSEAFRYAGVSITVLDLESGKKMAGINENRVLIPASTQKLLTSFTALDILGEDYQYETKINYSGKIDDQGTLNGNIYIIGSGDPTLGSHKFKESLAFEELIRRISKEIKRAGILKINGKIIADESIFNSFPISPSWQWNDLGNYYACGAWGININENQYTIRFSKRAKVGNRPKLTSYGPKVPGLELSNELVVDSAGTGDNAYIFGGPYNYKKRIVGTIPAGKGSFAIKGSIPDPPLFMAYHLMKRLNKDGIDVDEYETQYEPRKKRTKNIYTIFSPTLKQIAQRANLESNNLYSEALLKTIATKQSTGGSGGVGIYLMKRFLRKLKIKTESMHLEDGSGLSARNNLNSMLLATFLQRYANTFDDINEVLRYLPSAGVSGTLSKMFKNSSARGRVWAKTGTMDRVHNYAGYIRTKSGRWVSFAILVNGFSVNQQTMRKKLERLMTDIYKYG